MGMSAVQGEYASSVYQYVTATIVPCHKYKAEFEANGGTCESQAEIERVFLDSYGGASLWIKDQYNHKSSAWASKAYTSFSRNAWIGNEVYFEPTDYTKFNFWGQASEQTKFLTYRSFYQRQSAPNPNEYLKFYLRVSTSSKKVHEPSFRRGNIDWRKELDKLNGMQVTCYGIQCGNNDYASHFYDAIAAKTAGLKLKLSKFDSMPAIFIGICLKQVDPLGELLKEYESKLEQTGQMTGEKKKALHSLGKQAIIGAALTAGGVFTKVVLDA